MFSKLTGLTEKIRRAGWALVPLVASGFFACPLEALSQSTGATAPASGNANPPLAGSAQHTSLQTAQGLKAIGEALHKIKRAATEIIGECTREDLVVVSEPDVIGPIVLPAIPAPTGQLSMGDYLPPRKKWLLVGLSMLQQVVPILEDEIKDTVFPPDKADLVKDQVKQMQALADDMQTHVANLAPLINVDKPDRLAVGKEALAIHDDGEQIDKLRKEVFHLTR